MATYDWQDLEHCYGPGNVSVMFLVRYTVCTDAFTYYYQLQLSQYYLLRQIKFDIEVTQLSTNHNS